LHPNWENEKLGITAKSLTEATAALGSALTMQSAQEAEHKKTVTARDRATAKLRSRLRALLNELSLHLADDDPRWEMLGLKTPHSERAAKDARKEKAAQKAEDQQIRKLEVATRKYEVAKARSERLRVRADQQEAILFRLRQEQANAVNDAEALFRAVQELATEIGHPLPATLPRNVQPEAASDSTVSNNGNGQVKIELHS
jgi:siroheme synthase